MSIECALLKVIFKIKLIYIGLMLNIQVRCLLETSYLVLIIYEKTEQFITLASTPT